MGGSGGAGEGGVTVLSRETTGVGDDAGGAGWLHAAAASVTKSREAEAERRVMLKLNPRDWPVEAHGEQALQLPREGSRRSLTLIMTSPIFAHHTVFPAR